MRAEAKGIACKGDAPGDGNKDMTPNQRGRSYSLHSGELEQVPRLVLSQLHVGSGVINHLVR